MDNKVMVITGSRKGIGNYLAKFYLEKGFTVAGCSRQESAIKHKNHFHYVLDVSDEKNVINMVRDIKRKFKKIDILVNNAGIASMNHVTLTPVGVVNNIFNTNFLGVFLFTREVSKLMIRQKGGRIVNISSVAVPMTLEGESVYAASKSAVEEFTKVVAKELCEYNITVNCLGIAPIMTDLVKTVSKDKINKILDRMPIKRLAEFKDITNVIDFFIKEESAYITAQIIYLGGVS